MKKRKSSVAILLLFSVLAINAFARPQQSVPRHAIVRVSLPPLAHNVTIPVWTTIPRSLLTGTWLASGWRVSEGNWSAEAQFDARSGGICFLYPAAASPAPTTHTFAIEHGQKRAGSPFTIREQEQFVSVTENDQPVLNYNYRMMLKPGVAEDRRRSSYVHPLYAPGGVMIGDDFPRDHLHHRGLYWSWPNVDVGGEHYSLWDIRGVRQVYQRRIAHSTGPVFAEFGAENEWIAKERPILREHAIFRVYREVEGRRLMDVELTFNALEPVTIRGEQPDKKGYGGFCLRFGPRKDTVVRTPSGLQAKDSDGVPAEWADLSGTFDAQGHPQRAGAAIIVDPRNPGFPNGWTLRPYGFLGTAWPGMDSFTFEPGKPVTLRFRVCLHSGDLGAAEAAALYRAFETRGIPGRN